MFPALHRLFFRVRHARTTRSRPSPRRSPLRVEGFEDRCLLSGFVGPIQLAAPTLQPAATQHRIDVVQTLLTHAQDKLTSAEQARTNTLAQQLTTAQSAVSHIQTLVNKTQADLTADQQDQTNSLANGVTSAQRRVDKLQNDLTKAQAILTARQQHGSATSVANAQALVTKLQNALTTAQTQLATAQQLQQNPPTLPDITQDQTELQNRQTKLTDLQNRVTTIGQDQQNISSPQITYLQGRVQHWQNVLNQLQGH